MEFIKTQLQLKSATNPLPYNGMISGLTHTVKSTGFLSLYRGLTPTLIGSIPKAGIRFGLNAEIKEVRFIRLRSPCDRRVRSSSVRIATHGLHPLLN